MDPLTIENILDRARSFDFPSEPLGLAVASEETWRSCLAMADTERARRIQDSLDEIARRRAEEQDDEGRRHRAALLAGEEAPSPEEARAAEAFRVEAAADFERHEAGRPARVESLLQRIVSALEKR